MADEPTTSGGWLPPAAPGGKPAPRFDAPRWEPPVQPVAQPPEPPPGRTAPPEGRVFAPAERGDRGPRNSAAIWALAFGIVGLLLLVLSIGTFFVVTLPCSVAAWALGARAHRRIARGETAQGAGQATAALWLGRIGVIAGVAAMVVFIVLLASGFDFDQFRDDLQRELDRQRERQRDDGGTRTGLDGVRAVFWAWLPR
jgi:hypothetical protein